MNFTGFDLPDVDITNRDRVLQLAGEADPEFIFHCAAFTKVDQCESEIETAMRVNAIGTQNIAFLRRSCWCAAAYISTDYIFDGTKNGPYDEWDAANPQSVYGKSKWAGECLCAPTLSLALHRARWLIGKAEFHRDNFEALRVNGMN